MTLETTSPEAAVASLGCVGDGDGDGLPAGDGLPLGDGLSAGDGPPADGVASAEADAAGVPVAPVVGVGAADEAAPEGAVADADADGAAVADELGLGVAPPGEGRQKMIRMHF